MNSRGIRVDEESYEAGRSVTTPSFCPEQPEAFLDGNIYLQKNFQDPSPLPRINESGSEITTGANTFMTNGLGNWLNPQAGRPILRETIKSLWKASVITRRH